jgi:hypothetical protein
MSPLGPSLITSLFPTELRLTTNLFPTDVRSGLRPDPRSTTTLTPVDATPNASVLTARTGPRFTTKRWPGPTRAHPGKSNTRRSGCSSLRTPGCTISLNTTSTSTLSAPSATAMLIRQRYESRGPGPGLSWEITGGGAATPTKRNRSDIADSIRIAAADSPPFAALCRVHRVRDLSGDAL